MNAWQTNPKGRLRGGYFKCPITQEYVARMLFHFPKNMKDNEYWYNNLMQGHMLLQQFCPCKHPQKLNKLSCPVFVLNE